MDWKWFKYLPKVSFRGIGLHNAKLEAIRASLVFYILECGFKRMVDSLHYEFRILKNNLVDVREESNQKGGESQLKMEGQSPSHGGSRVRTKGKGRGMVA